MKLWYVTKALHLTKKQDIVNWDWDLEQNLINYFLHYFLPTLKILSIFQRKHFDTREMVWITFCCRFKGPVCLFSYLGIVMGYIYWYHYYLYKQTDSNREDCVISVHLLWPSDTIWRQRSKAPSLYPKQDRHIVDWNLNSRANLSKILVNKDFPSRKRTWKYRLQNVGHLSRSQCVEHKKELIQKYKPLDCP